MKRRSVKNWFEFAADSEFQFFLKKIFDSIFMDVASDREGYVNITPDFVVKIIAEQNLSRC